MREEETETEFFASALEEATWYIRTHRRWMPDVYVPEPDEVQDYVRRQMTYAGAGKPPRELLSSQDDDIDRAVQEAYKNAS